MLRAGQGVTYLQRSCQMRDLGQDAQYQGREACHSPVLPRRQGWTPATGQNMVESLGATRAARHGGSCRKQLFPALRGPGSFTQCRAMRSHRIQRRTTMSVIKVMDMAYGKLRSPDLDAQEEFLTHFGMVR